MGFILSFFNQINSILFEFLVYHDNCFNCFILKVYLMLFFSSSIGNSISLWSSYYVFISLCDIQDPFISYDSIKHDPSLQIEIHIECVIFLSSVLKNSFSSSYGILTSNSDVEFKTGNLH